ncbi:GNAT family N-acetyltransferase [Pseudarthrobacter raffinosi]|uniref:GNAT family N-acetyltransferase n=1 Tax=Pseudarthrobacter raffinosi TaxID=2953651 RepID=UPI00208F5875|nr:MULTISPECIES: hypothetical protein [unclassified Pseudarthrobacter]MCO4236141.1 hypothetical protein [Pseudarthrobacter sp. MDT3-28]MCO4262680.1 hypothetical protein [Pseudarthrobacter sp. MDT3-26]
MTYPVALQNMEQSDWPAIRRIYQQGIDTGQATFETQAPDWDSFDQSKLPGHRHVAVSSEGEVLGWAAVSPASSRPAYAGVAEHSIFTIVGRRNRIARMPHGPRAGQWRDTLLIERRSPAI